MATIRNRNGRWHVQVRRSGSKSVNRTFTLKSDAQLWAREQERAIELDRSLSDMAVETASFLLSVGGELAIYLIAQTAVLLALTG